jgi:hypothetical protein
VNVRIEVEFEIFICGLENGLCDFQILDIWSFRGWKLDFIDQVINSFFHRTLSHACFEFLQEFGSFIFPFIVNVGFALKPDHRNRSNESRLTDQLAFLSKETWNLRNKTENECDLFAWLDGLFGVMAEKFWFDVFDGIGVYLGFVLKFPLVVNRR